MPKTYSVKEAAKILGFSTNTIYTFLNTNKIQGIRIGRGRFRIPQVEIERLVGNPIAPTEEVLHGEVQHGQDEGIFVKTIPFLRHLSLTEWFIGIGSIIFGMAMFVYSATVEYNLTTQLTTWYSVIRILIILFGCGFLISKLFSSIPVVWGMIYHALLTILFGWFIFIAYLAHDAQGMIVTTFIFLIFVVQLFFMPAYHTMISFITLLIALSNTVFCIAFPSFFAQLIQPFGLTLSNSLLVRACLIGIPYLTYVALVVTHRWAKPLYYGIVTLISIGSIVAAYFVGVNLFWRQGIALLFTGIALFLYVIWQTPAMKEHKKTWITGIVFAIIMFHFLVIVFSLKVFELTMYSYASRELQVKAENGKLFLDTLFEYAQTSFSAQAVDKALLADVAKKDRVALTADAKRMFEQYPHMSHVAILNAEGTEIGNYPEDPALVGGNFAYRPYFQRALTTGKTVISDAFLTMETVRKYTIVMATPLTENGVIKGVLVGSFDMSGIGRELQSFAADEQGEYFGVFDEKGLRIIHPNKDVIGTTLSKDDLAKFSIIPYWKMNLDTRTNPNGELVLATYRTTDFGNLNISVVEPYRENLQANPVAFAVTCILAIYGYIVILIPWVICQRKYKKSLMHS